MSYPTEVNDLQCDPVIKLDLNIHQQNIILYALHVAIPHMHSNAAKGDAKSMIETIKEARNTALAESLQPTQEGGESDPYPNCTLECGGLTNWCKCRSDADALAELEKRNGN